MQTTAFAPTHQGLQTASFSLAWLRALVRHMRQARHERQQLRGLDSRTLSDLGLSRDMALREADRLPWDLPARFEAELSTHR